MLYMCIRQILYIWFDIQLPLPDTVTDRMWHSLSAIQLSPHNVLLVAFGGQRSLLGDNLSHTALVKLSEYVLQYSSYSDRHCIVVLGYTYCIDM